MSLANGRFSTPRDPMDTPNRAMSAHGMRKLAGCMLLSLCGVAASVANAAETLAREPAADLYRIGRGDELNLRFLYTPELNTDATVRSDGRVGLPLIGDVRVEGLSTQELTTQVQEALKERVKRPQLTVNVRGAAASQRVFVGGEVAMPGAQSLVGPLTVLQAVLAAQGMKDTAQAREVLVLRRQAGSTSPSVLKVDLASLMAGREGAQDLALAPQDVVLVPRSGISSLNLWVDQYLRRNLPVNFGVNYTINPDRNTP